MTTMTTKSKVAQTFLPVKSINSQLPLFSLDSMIHHNVSPSGGKLIVSYSTIKRGIPYGVSPACRVLSPQLLLKKYDLVRECLKHTIKLSIAEREVTLRLLRFWAYYGNVYPKASTITADPGCSKATFWRTMQLLKELGLVRVVNRYVVRPHAQISNLYRLDRLVLVIARYLAEHGVPFREKWLTPYLVMPGRLFWGATASTLWLSGEP